MSGTRTRSPPTPPRNNGRLNIGGRSPDIRGGGLGLFNEQGGRQAGFSEANSFFQQSNQHQESHTTSSTTQKNNSSEASRKYEYSEETRTRARRLTLADCELELEGTSVLVISPRAGGIEFEASTVILDDFVGNMGGELVWGGTQFSGSCNTIRLDQTFLLALCSRTSKDGKTEEYIQAKLNLDDHIAFIMARRRFEAIPPDPAFSEMMSAANWMNLTVITQPDMGRFLKNKAFQDAIGGVARRAMEEAMNRMREEMNRAVEEAVRRVTAEAEEYVQTEMDTLIKRASKSAAYAGLAQLKIMEIQQRMAYNEFAPFIAAPVMEEDNRSEFGFH